MNNEKAWRGNTGRLWTFLSGAPLSLERTRLSFGLLICEMEMTPCLPPRYCKVKGDYSGRQVKLRGRHTRAESSSAGPTFPVVLIPFKEHLRLMPNLWISALAVKHYTHAAGASERTQTRIHFLSAQASEYHLDYSMLELILGGSGGNLGTQGHRGTKLCKTISR